MSTLGRAFELALLHHGQQVDKSGEPYLFHLLRVMFHAETDEEKQAFLLHDIVEDTPVTFSMLEKEGFSPLVISAIESVTRREHESYDHFVRRAIAHPIGRKLKWFDILDNSDPKRLEKLDQATRKRLETKYDKAKQLFD